METGSLTGALVAAADIDRVMGCSESAWDGGRQAQVATPLVESGVREGGMCACSLVVVTLKRCQRVILTNEHANMLVVWRKVPSYYIPDHPKCASVSSDVLAALPLETDSLGIRGPKYCNALQPVTLDLTAASDPGRRTKSEVVSSPPTSGLMDIGLPCRSMVEESVGAEKVRHCAQFVPAERESGVRPAQ
jgi:hypothetical protein